MTQFIRLKAYLQVNIFQLDISAFRPGSIVGKKVYAVVQKIYIRSNDCNNSFTAN